MVELLSWGVQIPTHKHVPMVVLCATVVNTQTDRLITSGYIGLQLSTSLIIHCTQYIGLSSGLMSVMGLTLNSDYRASSINFKFN